MKLRATLTLLATLTLSLAPSCKKDAPASTAGTAAKPAGAAPAPAPAPAPAAAPLVRATVGVAECDEWLRKVEACMAKDPAMRSRYEPGFKVVNVAWPKNFAAGGATRAALAGGCKTSLETLDAACK